MKKKSTQKKACFPIAGPKVAERLRESAMATGDHVPFISVSAHVENKVVHVHFVASNFPTEDIDTATRLIVEQIAKLKTQGPQRSPVKKRKA